MTYKNCFDIDQYFHELVTCVSNQILPSQYTSEDIDMIESSGLAKLLAFLGMMASGSTSLTLQPWINKSLRCTTLYVCA